MRWIPLLAVMGLGIACASRHPHTSQAAVLDAPVVSTPGTINVAAGTAAGSIAPRDSVLLAATQLELRVGEAYLIGQLTPKRRDATGAVTPMRRWILVVPENEVYEVRQNRVWARRAGQAALYVQEPTDSSSPPSAPRASTRVSITVRP